MRVASKRVLAEREGECPRAPRRDPLPFGRSSSGGWTLIELVITLTVMAVLTMAVIPIVRTSVRRQREIRLREALRDMRRAIDEFHRDTVMMTCPGSATPPPAYLDPRSRVVIADCTIFGVDNPERYPPSLDTLVEGVNVRPRAAQGPPDINRRPTDNDTSLKKKIYLREIPVDPITGRAEWCILSNYDDADSGCASNPNNVFDVRSMAEGEALNGEKYSDW